MQDEDTQLPIGAGGAQLKQQTIDDKQDKKAEPFDPGAAMLGTDNEAGAPPDHDGSASVASARSCVAMAWTGVP